MANVCRMGGLFFALALSAVVWGGAIAGEAAGGITAERAKEIALAQTGGGEVIVVDRHYRGDGYYFRVVVLGDDGAFQIMVDADDGKLMQFIRKHGYKGDKKYKRYLPPQSGVVTDGNPITMEQALAIALEQTGGGTVIDSDVDVKRNGRVRYEFEIVSDGAKYEIEIDGATGAIIEFERNGRHYYVPDRFVTSAPDFAPKALVVVPDPEAGGAPSGDASTAGAKIGAEAAQALAKGTVGGGMVTEYKLETSGGRFVHEIVVVFNNQRYRLEIDDDSGAVRELSVRDVK